MKTAAASVSATASQTSLRRRCVRSRTTHREMARCIAIAYKDTGAGRRARALLAARQKGTDFCTMSKRGVEWVRPAPLKPTHCTAEQQEHIGRQQAVKLRRLLCQEGYGGAEEFGKQHRQRQHDRQQ